MQKPAKTTSGRLAFLDWTRGLAAVVMLQGHAFHSFTRTDLRDAGPYVVSQFLGGMPPAVFLFLLGLTLSFLMDSREKRGDSSRQRIAAAFRRAGYLLMVAFLFRIQLWVFGLPGSPWTDIFKVDILNSMALAVAVMSTMAIFSTKERIRLCAVLGLLIAAVSPFVSQVNWSYFPPMVRGYLAPDHLSFAFFPWAAFVAFGMSAGSVIRISSAEAMERVMQWSAIIGFGLIVGGQYFSSVPYSMYPKSEFWLDSPWLVLIKLGVILLLLPFAFLWTRHAETKWSWVRQFGTTSLLVYWVHIELIYGRWLWFWKESLTIAQTAVCAVLLIVLMLGISTARTQWKNWRLLGFSLGSYNYFSIRKAD
jgi:uncharacterized membrane protein